MISFRANAQPLRASDNAGNYPGGWTNGSNGGTGFGPWFFEITQSTANEAYAGTFLGDPANALITGMGTNAFGLYANTGSSFWDAVAKATRPIPVPLQIGEKLRFKWGINWDGDRANGNKGFNLYVSNTEVINVNNAGGNSTITFNGQDTGFGYGTQAMIWTFERLNASTLRVTANDRDGTGQFSMDFNTGNSAIDSVAFYASNMGGSPEREPYFNDLEIDNSNAASLTVSPTSLSGFSTLLGSASANQTFQVTGSRLTGDIAVSAPANFEVASETGPFGATLTIPQSGGNASATVRVRIAASATSPSLSGNISITSQNATARSVALSGEVLRPTLAVNPASLTGFSAFFGNASASQSFAVTGIRLSQDITITAPSQFEVALENGTFGPSVTVPQTGGNASATVFVRIAASATQESPSGSISVSSQNAETKYVSVSGVVLRPSISFTPSSLGRFTTLQGNASASQSFQVSGTLLTEGITINASQDFEVALGNGTFGSSVTIPQTSGNATGTVQVRIAASAGLAEFLTGSISFLSGNAEMRTLALLGMVVSGPTIAVDRSSLFFSSTLGNYSQTEFLQVSGAQLTGNLTVTTSGPFLVATGIGEFGTSLSIAPSSGDLMASLRVTMSPGYVEGSTSGSITISGGGAPTRTIQLSGYTSSMPNPIYHFYVSTGSLQLGTAIFGAPYPAGSFNSSFDIQFGIGGSFQPQLVFVYAPPGIEVSTNNATFSSSLTFSGQAQVFVRISNQTPAGPVSGTIEVYGFERRYIAVSGEVVIPSISTSTASLGNFTTGLGTASGAQSFQAAGSNLSTGIAVEAPSGFEVSTNNSTFSSNLTLAQTGGNANATVLVRVSANAPSGPLAGNLTLSSPGAATRSVALAGAVLFDSISATPNRLENFIAVVGSASEVQFFQVEAVGISGNISVEAPSGFQVSSDNSTFGASTTSATTNGTVYVRIASNAPLGPVSGNITLSSPSASSQTVAVSGAVLTEYEAGFQAGSASVIANPATWDLFTRQQYDASREAGRADVTSNPTLYNLHTADSIMDMNLGGVMIQSTGGGNATLRLQLQSTPDLATQAFEDDGAPIEIPVQMDGTKGFLRIRALGPQ